MSVKKERKYFIVGIAVFVIVVLGIVAGLYCYINRFDPQEYVQAFLDVSYKQKTEVYVELTGISEDEAEQIFENNLDYTMNKFPSEVMTEELKKEYRSLFGSLAKKADYTVDEAKREEDGSYQVELTVKPILLLRDTYQTFQEQAQEYATQVSNDVMNGQAMPEEQEMQTAVYQIYYDVLKKAMDQGIHYGSACKMTLHLDQDEQGYYQIRKSDLQRLDQLLIKEVENDENANDEN